MALLVADDLWAVVEPLLPLERLKPKGGRPRAPDRAALAGIAIQTVVLVALDAFGGRGREPLTYRAASLTLVLEGVLVVAVLIVAIMASRLPADLIAARVAPGGVLIALLWVAGIWLISWAGKDLP